jgi:hypothetical protein
VQIVGDLVLEQKSPLAIGSIQRFLYNKTLDSLFIDLTFSQILEDVYKRN